ncbi:sugar ABC transporter ATP-binding protein [Mycetocola tolaasinivorans]|uniref:Sugar ABC transporter ATP-binding protein n=1 Tax=Mycetocola tolaasinivorans TaxID=76635 RepID=A0A3L7A687_9MICO|nr:sugar ABC transporter ATP-binding protein [Mycetocola tolaasinivorans]RLP75575.1 sugar ABC transporter ATP-binding protein [Mycetocola tolaasinivorans]
MTENSGLIVTNISKSYGPTRVLSDVSIRIRPGEVVALIGHNGAGKSTLLRSLSGAEVPDQGSISVDGDDTPFGSPRDATAAGIACVYQELSLIDELTVAENLFLGDEQLSGPLLNRRLMNRRADELCAEYGIAARGTDTVRALPVAQRQLLEVARAISRNARYILLDEPTTALEQDQVEGLLAVIRRVTKERGVGILLVDHKLDEVFAIADQIVGLANGNIVLDGSITEVDRGAVIDAIVGDHDLVADGPHEEAEPLSAETLAEDEASRAERFGEPALVVSGLAGNNLDGVDLTVRAGEILGIYGLVGSGRSRFLRTVYGAEPMAEGTMSLYGVPYSPKNPGQAIAQRVTFLSEERKSDGFIPQMSSLENVTLPVLSRYTSAGLLSAKKLRAAATEALSGVRIRGNAEAPITSLSGGNQQKALFARAAIQRPRVLLLDEPTKGVDIGAKREIYGIIRDLAHNENVAVIVVSSDEEELMTVADTITVFRSGSCDGVTYAQGHATAPMLRELAWTDSDAA